MTVWKFTLEVADNVTVAMPIGAEVLHVGRQNGELCLWAKVDPKVPHSFRTFYVTGTGNRCPDDATYIGSVLAAPFVWHVWQEDVAA